MSTEKNAKTIERSAELLRASAASLPVSLVDRIIEVNADKSCIGIKNVTFNEPFFQGHFPNRPVMPGVLMIEGMAQTAGAICAKSIGLQGRAAERLLSDGR